MSLNRNIDASDHDSSVLSAVTEEDGKDTSSSKLSSETGSTSIRNTSTSKAETEIAKDETKLVKCSKLLVYAVLILAAIGSGIAAYKFVKKGEVHDFDKAVSTCAFYVPSQSILCMPMDSKLTLKLHSIID